MPADAKVSGLHLGQTLPIMKVFFFDVALNVTVAPSASQTFQLIQFTMPFFGDFICQSGFRMKTNSAGVQAPVCQISALSTPAPSYNPGSLWRTEGGAQFGNTVTPVFGGWSGVAPTTVVTVLGVIFNGGGAMSTTVDRGSGFIFCTKT